MLLQALYNLSDLKAEFQILDQRSFGRFLGLDDGDEVPDETTIGYYREALIHSDTIKNRFDASLRNNGYPAMSGQIVEETIVQALKQRMTNEE